MDVQTENTDPPPNESQPTGKIRKGFKLFGKRKPGNIFSIRSKGDGNNKSPVIRSKTSEGLSETPAQDSEQEQDNKDGRAGKQEDGEQPEDETLGEDGVLATAPARTSISSTSSAKSLSFLSLLRGGRRGVGDRKVQTVSQPVARQRRGLKGLFSNVKLRSKDKEDKEEAPPSPLLQSSRTNSVEIIKEDLTLTPRCEPRTVDSPEAKSSQAVPSATTQKSSAMTPSKTPAPQVTSAENVSNTNQHVSPLLTPEPPLVPGDNSLSSLLADISSLLTFDSISGGGDIMADVEAEWGKVSSVFSAEVPPSSTSPLSKSTLSSSPTTSSAVSAAATVKPPSVAASSSSSSSTLTTHSVKLSFDSTPASPQGKQTPAPTSTKPSTAPSTSKTVPSTLSSISTTTAPPAYASATGGKAPSFSPSLTSTANKVATEIAQAPQNASAVSKPVPVSISPAVSTKPVPIPHSPPITVTQPPSASSFNVEKSTYFKPSQSSSVAEPKVPLALSATSTVTTTSSSSAPVIPSKITSVTTLTSASGSASLGLSKPTLTPNHLDLNKTVSDPGAYSTFTAAIKTQLSSASVPAPSSASLDKIPPATKPSTTSVSLDKIPPAQPTATAAPSHVASTSSLTPSARDQMKVPPADTQIPASKERPAPTQIEVSESKVCPAPLKLPVSVSKDPSALVKVQDSSSKVPTSPPEIPESVSKELSGHVKVQASSSKVPPSPAEIPVFASKTPPATAQTKFSPPETPVTQSADAPRHGSFQVSPPKATPASLPQPKTPEPKVASCPSPPVSWQIDASSSAKIKSSVQAPADSLDGAGGQRSQGAPSKANGPHHELPPKEKKTQQSKATGLSKIPVVGGGRIGRQPVRESQHDEPSKDPTSPVLEEKPHFNSHNAGSKDKISSPEANAPTSKHLQEEHQQPQQVKGLTSSARDSKIPLKHGAPSHAASQVSQAKEPPRTKIPVSKVPVRRAGNKPGPTGGSTQTRK